MLVVAVLTPHEPEACRRRQDSARRLSLTVMAPPMRVAIWAKGINGILFAAVRMATSPALPWPLWQAFTTAASME